METITKNAVESIPLTLIDPNPWQPREREDREHIEKLALSIAAEGGLLQIPTARQIGLHFKRYQLAFGHSRLAAYWLLYQVQVDLEDQKPIDFEDDSLLQQVVIAADAALEKGIHFNAMPLSIRELSDETMFRYAIRENNDRKDLNAMEKSRAMRRYRDEFGKTSAEIGELFGLSESAVRNKMRLLDLPPETQALVSDGALGEMTARKLLSVEKVLPGASDKIAEDLATNGITSPDRVSERIENTIREKGRLMFDARWAHNQGVEPNGGQGLWPLDWTPGVVKANPKQFLEAFPRWKADDWCSWIAPGEEAATHYFRKAAVNLAIYPNSGPGSMMMELAAGTPKEIIENAYHLLRPPACTACPFCLRLDGRYWCMMEACWKNKKAAWLQAELERLSKELEIPIYNRAEDGPCEEFTSQWSSNQNAAQWFEERADHLRLKISYNEYGTNYLTDSKAAAVVSVRKEIQEKKADEKEEERKEKQIADYEKIRREATERFVRDQVYPHLKEQILGGFHHAGAIALMGDPWQFRNLDMSSPTDPDVIDQARTILLENKLRYMFLGKSPVGLAKKLVHELLPSWGVKIPGDLVQKAKQYEVELEKQE